MTKVPLQLALTLNCGLCEATFTHHHDLAVDATLYASPTLQAAEAAGWQRLLYGYLCPKHRVEIRDA